MGLAENREELHIIPASYGVEESLGLNGTKVLMKAGAKMPDVKQAVAARKMEIHMVENCGMPGEAVYPDLSRERPPEHTGYFATLIVRR